MFSFFYRKFLFEIQGLLFQKMHGFPQFSFWIPIALAKFFFKVNRSDCFASGIGHSSDTEVKHEVLISAMCEINQVRIVFI